MFSQIQISIVSDQTPTRRILELMQKPFATSIEEIRTTFSVMCNILCVLTTFLDMQTFEKTKDPTRVLQRDLLTMLVYYRYPEMHREGEMQKLLLMPEKLFWKLVSLFMNDFENDISLLERYWCNYSTEKIFIGRNEKVDMTDKIFRTLYKFHSYNYHVVIPKQIEHIIFQYQQLQEVVSVLNVADVPELIVSYIEVIN